MRLIPLAAAAACASIASPALADPKPVVDAPASKAAAAADGVTVFVINDSETEQPVAPPATLDAIARDGTPIKLVLDPAATAPPQTVAAHGFAKLGYRLADEQPAAVAVTTPPLAPPPVVISGSGAATASPSPYEQVTLAPRGSSSAFLDRLSTYEPIYGVWGPGRSGAKLQFSLEARPIAGTGVLSHLRFAYTQQIFWDVNADSGPIRSATYSPELFFEFPVAPSAQLAFGYRHDSNGGGVADSVDINRFYVKVNKSFDLGHGWQINVAPQLWYDAFQHGIANDIDDYWGYAAITASIEQRDGIKLSVYARGNPATGKGASEMFLSYPVRRLGIGDAGIYLFGQLFTGYGEQLIDYNREDTRARIGISFTR